MDEEENVIKGRMLNDSVGDRRYTMYLRKKARSLISYVIISGSRFNAVSLDL